MPTAVFVRHTHPVSQGNLSYSVAIVKYDTAEELQRLIKFFGYESSGLPEPLGHGYQWYGGNCFDLIATFPVNPETLTTQQLPLLTDSDPKSNKHSTGDHRWVGYYTAEELLGKQYLETEPFDEDLTDWCGCDCELCMDGRCGQGDCEHAYD